LDKVVKDRKCFCEARNLIYLVRKILHAFTTCIMNRNN
jgi:hypothetical protein